MKYKVKIKDVKRVEHVLSYLYTKSFELEDEKTRIKNLILESFDDDDFLDNVNRYNTICERIHVYDIVLNGFLGNDLEITEDKEENDET